MQKLFSFLSFVAPSGGKCHLQQVSHNAFKVKGSIEEWNGDRGSITAELYTGQHLEHAKPCGEKTCAFEFTNLYYSTEYRIKVLVLTFVYI